MFRNVDINVEMKVGVVGVGVVLVVLPYCSKV